MDPGGFHPLRERRRQEEYPEIQQGQVEVDRAAGEGVGQGRMDGVGEGQTCLVYAASQSECS